MLESLQRTADFVLRLAFFALAPLLIVLVTAVFPVTGALVTIGLALAVFLFAEAAKNLTTRFPILKKALSGQLEFEAYYRAHPPKPFLYYVFYPLLFPYWLVEPKARKEFLLYKGYTLVSIGLLVLGAGWQFYRYWLPELGFLQFAAVFAAQLLVETLLVLMLVMPIVTSVVKLHATGERWRLAALLLVGLASSGVAVYRIEKRRDPIVSFATRERVGMRTDSKPELAKKAERAALKAAWKVLPKEMDDVDKDGKVEGEALEAAHEALLAFYKQDEAFAFDVWLGKAPKKHGADGPAIMVVYFEARRGKPPIFLASTRMGYEIADPKALPKGALVAMKHAADGVLEE